VRPLRPRLTRNEFFEQVALGFGLSSAAARSKTRLLAELVPTLEASVEQRRPNALIVDEAHELPPDLLDEIRLLSNLETDDHKLLPIVLAGLPEFTERLQDPRNWQLMQRVVLRCSLARLQPSETAAYIAGRIRVAGGDAATVLTAEAVELIHRHARGLPRTLNVICDNALVAGFAADERPVGARTVEAVCRELNLRIPLLAEEAGEQPSSRADAAATRSEGGRARPRVDAEPDPAPPPTSVRFKAFGRFFS
jgi:type II secretory pathway predicted ATPase ExeA